MLFAALIVLLWITQNATNVFAMFGTGFVSINCGESLGFLSIVFLLIWEWQPMF